VAFDASLSTSFRNQIYPAYKANREPAPPDLVLQFERCRAVLRTAWHRLVRQPGVRGRRSHRHAGRAHARRRPALHDRLARQGPGAADHAGDVYWDYSGNARYHHGEIEGRFGVAPERYADYLALTGDAVDNIAGVPGVGPKTATVLMRAFATLEELYERLDVVHDLPLRGAAAVVARLAQHREAAFLARQLTRIRCDVMLPVTRHQLQRRPPDLPAIDDFCGSNGFGSLIRNQAARLPQP
jgi:DNA polymerase-1